MESRLDTLIDLLHRCADGALATHSVAMPGYPFATALPFATDDQHRPVFLISRLAEHTQNLAADARASLLVRVLLTDGEMARATVVGKVAPIEAGPLLVERYLRYQPEAARFLQFGDFAFFRLEPAKIRIVGGFGQAGWLDGNRIAVPPRLTLAAEQALFDVLTVPDGISLLGVDYFGVDLRVGDQRRRVAFDNAPPQPDELQAASQAAIDALACGN
jgi:putative heme iron utilization protein